MRRYFILVILFVLTLPFGISVVGCGTNKNANYCNGLGYGLRSDAVAAINLEPKINGISLSYSQTGQVNQPTATNCKGGTVAVGGYNYGTSDMTLADISPTGAVCAGTWNRTTGGGIAPFTTCLPTNKTGVALVTAQAGGVTSNTVAIFVHPTITNISLDVINRQTGAGGPGAQTGCYSQGQTAQLSATAFVEGNSTTPFCAPNSGNPAIPDCSTNLGHLTYSPVTSGLVSIDQNGVATAQLPGSTVISATIAGTSSNAGYFYTCPPKSIALTSNGNTNINITPNTPQPLVASVIDTNGNPITGLPLAYTTTTPQAITASSTGVTSTFPSSAAVYAVCQPPTCNTSPINEIGVNGNGTPVVSNTVTVTSPGNSSTYLWLASPASQYFVPVDLTTGTTGTAVRLPYVPNSMVLDQPGTNLYFGSYRELMVFNAISNSLTREDTSVPGVVLAVSPDGGTVLINDQDRQVFYLYTPTTQTVTSSFGGVGQRAIFSPDSTTLYIAGQNTLYVHNSFSGWSVEQLTGNTGNSSATCPFTPGNTTYNSFCSPDLALAVPSVAAFISGATTTAYGFCPDTRPNPAINYPQAAALPVTTDHLAATNDGKHIIGATATPAVLTDSTIALPSANPAAPVGACPTVPVTQNGTTVNKTVGITIGNPGNAQLSLAPYGIGNVDQVVTAPDSSVAFVTYTSAATTPPAGGAILPAYQIPAQAGATGTLANVTLAAPATAPLAGIFSPDYQTFFVGTAGDNAIHLISTKTLTDTKQLFPKLTDSSGNPTPVRFLAVKPRPTT